MPQNVSLQTKEPPLKFSPEVNKALSIDVSELTGVRYKVLDDLVDGIFCAYLAYYFWYWGEERCWVVGDMKDGYVTLWAASRALSSRIRICRPASRLQYMPARSPISAGISRPGTPRARKNPASASAEDTGGPGS